MSRFGQSAPTRHPSQIASYQINSNKGDMIWRESGIGKVWRRIRDSTACAATITYHHVIHLLIWHLGETKNKTPYAFLDGHHFPPLL